MKDFLLYLLPFDAISWLMFVGIIACGLFWLMLNITEWRVKRDVGENENE